MNHLITYGTENFNNSKLRLLEEAINTDWFTTVTLYGPEHLSDEFKETFKTLLLEQRGAGYWIWKSYIIKKTMENMNDGDILLYLDCGCELDFKIKNELLKSIDIVKTDKIIGTLTCTEKYYNKMDLVEKLDMNKDIYLNSAQRQGGTNLYLVCNETRHLVNEWYKIACDYNNIDDSPSINKNIPSFKEHRHDQSIFSLLTKKYNIYSEQTLDNAIYCIKNRTGISKLAASPSPPHIALGP
jgi:hypothetical protein